MPTRLLALGSNGSGQLGIGGTADTAIPTRCSFVATAATAAGEGGGEGEGGLRPHETIEALAAGGNHTLLLTSENRVFAAGSNESGRCALPPSPGHDVGLGTDGVFRLVQWRERGATVPAKVTHVAATWEASFFVVDGRRVYACGRGMKGELGGGEGRDVLLQPELILDVGSRCGEDVSIISLCASMAHTVVLTSQLRLFGWGGSRKGQLGPELSERKISWVPGEIGVSAPLSSIWKVAVGRDFTVIVDHDGFGVVYGNKAPFADDFEGFEVKPEDGLYSGWSNIFIHRSSGLVGFGRNNNGQLPPMRLPPIKRNLFAAGSEHALAVTTDSDVVAWGWGEHGNCGSASTDPQDAQRGWNVLDVDLQDRERVFFVGAGCATSFIAISEPD